MRRFRPILLGIVLVSLGCADRSGPEDESLPILGERTTDPFTGDIVYYQAPEFNLVSQHGEAFSNADVNGKIHVVDFFFTSCPTICPKMTTHLKVVQNHFKGDSRVQMVSYSIDGGNDTPEVLNSYANAFQIDTEQWELLTGNPEQIFEVAKGYKVRAFDDSVGEQANLIHDGTFVLLDGKRRIRGYYNGLEFADTQRLIDDMEILLKKM